ncbi:hypothetical protein IMZ31_16945 [Pontibacillus sp. ALD_SL1]|uniref:hypothetical protein n=1 Tax=Pontibacillus sp. ALD_SL1 TaxID=2777185 RepID=UPI001A95D496|nr:hypothetical protein [Pontibacillus sp. ALD_SL1]QSS99729.1 hypothetical protein IMZ31_16945 [Pontibacillus sp. ALD_SL1]
MLENLFFLLALISFLAIIIGIIKPPLVLWWGKSKKRRHVLLQYGLILIISISASTYIYETSPERVEQKKVIALAEEAITKGEYEEARQYANQSEDILSNSSSSRIIDTTNALIASDQSYKEGSALMEQEDYEGAIASLSNVIEDDTKNFEDAQMALNKGKEQVAQKYTGDSLEHLMKHDYTSALQTSDDGIQYSNNSGDLYAIRGLAKVAIFLKQNALSHWADEFYYINNEIFNEPYNQDNPEEVLRFLKKRDQAHQQAVQYLDQSNDVVESFRSDIEKAISLGTSFSDLDLFLDKQEGVKELVKQGKNYHDRSIGLSDEIRDSKKLVDKIQDTSSSSGVNANRVFNGLVSFYGETAQNRVWDNRFEADEPFEVLEKQQAVDSRENFLHGVVNLLTDSKDEKLMKLQQELEEQMADIESLTNEVESLAYETYNTAERASVDVKDLKSVARGFTINNKDEAVALWTDGQSKTDVANVNSTPKEQTTQPQANIKNKDDAIQFIADLVYQGSTEDLIVSKLQQNVYVVELAPDLGSGLLTTLNAYLIVDGKVVDFFDNEEGDPEAFWETVGDYE